MQIFNISLLEFAFIILLAFIVLGPEKGVEAAGNLGRWIRRVVKSPFWRELVSTSRDIKDIPRKIMDDAEIQKTLDDIERSSTIKSSNFIKSSIKEDVSTKKEDAGDNKILPE